MSPILLVLQQYQCDRHAAPLNAHESLYAAQSAVLLKNSAAVLPVNASSVKRILLFGALIVRSLHCSWTTLSSGVSVAHRLAARLAASWLSPPYGTAERTVTTLVVCPDAARSDRTTARTVPLWPRLLVRCELLGVDSVCVSFVCVV